jgi:hypothetical protein
MTEAQRRKQGSAALDSTDTPLTAPGPDNRRIAERAYQRYEARGREDGHELEDWLSAEQELRQQASDSATPERSSGEQG